MKNKKFSIKLTQDQANKLIDSMCEEGKIFVRRYLTKNETLVITQEKLEKGVEAFKVFYKKQENSDYDFYGFKTYSVLVHLRAFMEYTLDVLYEDTELTFFYHRYEPSSKNKMIGKFIKDLKRINETT